MYRDQFGEFVCGYWGLKGYLQPRFDEATKLFHKLRDGGSPYHGSLLVTEYECLWPCRSCVKAGVFPTPKIFTLAQSMEWPESLVCLDTADLRSQACTDFWCWISLGPVSLLFHQCTLHYNHYIWYCKWPHLQEPTTKPREWPSARVNAKGLSTSSCRRYTKLVLILPPSISSLLISLRV